MTRMGRIGEDVENLPIPLEPPESSCRPRLTPPTSRADVSD